MVIDNLQANAKLAEQIVIATAKKISLLRPKSSSHLSLKDGLMTSKERVNKETRRKINIFTEPYWGSFIN